MISSGDMKKLMDLADGIMKDMDAKVRNNPNGESTDTLKDGKYWKLSEHDMHLIKFAETIYLRNLVMNQITLR